MGILSAKKAGEGREKDFTKKKRRVGKTAPDLKNVTKTVISTKSLIIPQQNLRLLKDNEDATLMVTEILEKMTHHSGTMRAEVFSKLTALFTRRPEILVEHIQHLIPHFGEAMSDEDPAVRHALCACLYLHLPSVTPQKMSQFFDMLLQYVLAALNNIQTHVRDDAIHYIRLIVVLYPEHLSTHALTLLINLSGLLAEKELFAARTSSVNRSYSFPTGFVGCKLTYWMGIYEHCVAINQQHDLSADLSTSSQTLSTHQQALNDIKEQLQSKQQRSGNSPFLDQFISGFSTQQKDLSEQSLLYLPNNTALTHIQTLLFTIEVILKHCLPQNLATLVACLNDAQSTTQFQLPTNPSSPSSPQPDHLTATSTLSQNHTHIKTPMFDQIAFNHGTSTRDELVSTINSLVPLISATSTQSSTPSITDQTASSNSKKKSQLTAENYQQIVVAQTLTNSTRVATAFQIQPILSTVLKALLSCWDTYAPLDWSPARTGMSTSFGEARDVFEQADQASTFASHSIKGNPNGPSQRKTGKLKAQGTNSVATNTPPIQLQHSYTLLISIIASIYYLSHLDLQCKSNDFSMTIHQASLFQRLSSERIKVGKSFILPFTDLPELPTFNIFHIAPLNFYPYHTADKSFFHLFAQLNLWTSRLISLLIPCIPAQLTPPQITAVLLKYQVQSLTVKCDEIQQMYFHIKRRVETRLQVEGSLAPSQSKLNAEAAERERVKLLNFYGVKTSKKKTSQQQQEQNNGKSGNGDVFREFENLEKFEPFLLNNNVENQNTDPMYVEYRTLYIKYHKQLQHIQKYSQNLSNANEELLKRCQGYYNVAQQREMQLLGFLRQSLSQYQTEERNFIELHHQRVAKYVEQETFVNGQAKPQTHQSASNIGSVKRRRQPLVDIDDDIVNGETEAGQSVVEAVESGVHPATVELIHQAEEGTDQDEDDDADMTGGEDEVEDKFNSLLQFDITATMSEEASSNDESTSTLNFRDFLELFWEVIPCLSSTPQLNLLQLYTSFYQTLSMEPLSTIKLIAALPLVLFPRLEYHGEKWRDAGLSKQWLLSFPALIKAAIKVATFQKGAWLLSGPTGHKLLKQINWQFIISSIGTCISYFSMKFGDEHSFDSIDIDLNPETEMTDDIPQKSLKGRKKPSKSPKQLTTTTTTTTTSSEPTTPSILSTSHINSTLAHLLVDSYQSHVTDSKSTPRDAGLAVYQVDISYGQIINALRWSLEQSQKGLALPIQFYQTFIPLIIEQLLSNHQLDDHILSTISYIITSQLTFPKSPQQQLSTTSGSFELTTAPLLSPSTCQYFQDITLLHPSLSPTDQLSFLFSSSLSALTSHLGTQSLSPPTQYPHISAFATFGPAQITTNFVLHVLRLSSRSSDLFHSTINPLLHTHIKYVTSVNIWNPSFNMIDSIEVFQSNASKLMQLLAILHIFYSAPSNFDETVSPLVFVITKSYATWFLLNGFAINNFSTTRSATTTASTTASTTAQTQSEITMTSLEDTQSTQSKNTALADAARYISKFQKAKQANLHLSFTGLNPSTIDAIQQFSPQFHLHTTHHNPTKYLIAINANVQSTTQYSLHPITDQLASHFAFTLFQPSLLALDYAMGLKNSAFLWELLLTIFQLVSQSSTSKPTIPTHIQFTRELQTTITAVGNNQTVIAMTKAHPFQIDQLFHFFDIFFSLLPIQSTFLQLITEQSDAHDEVIQQSKQSKQSKQSDESQQSTYYTPVECVLVQLCYYGQHVLNPKHSNNGGLSLANLTRFCAQVKNLASLSHAFHTQSFNFQ